jgi:hypothetical protein
MVLRLPCYSSDLAGRIVYPAAFEVLGYERRVAELRGASLRSAGSARLRPTR